MKPKSNLKWLLIVLAAVIIGGGLYYYFVFFKTNNKPQPKTSPSSSSSPIASPSQNVSTNVDKDILKISNGKNGISVGYIPKTNTSRNNFFKKVFARDFEYDAVLFYAKKVGNLPQVYQYNFENKQETAISNDQNAGNSKPVFSSVGQKLAYSHYPNLKPDGTPNYGVCDTFVYDLQTKNIVKKIENQGRCATPIAWSPNGKRLLIFAHKLGSSETVYQIFDALTITVKDITSPQTGLIGSVWAGWIDDKTIYTDYLDTNNKTIIYKINITDGSSAPISLSFPNARSFQLNSQEIFYLTTERLSSEITFKVAKENLEGAKEAKIINQTEAVYDYLIDNRKDSKSGVLVYSRARNSHFSEPESIISINLKDGKISESISTPGDSAQLLGWYYDYDHLLYWIAPGGSSATSASINLLQLSNNKITNVVSNLSIVQ